MSHPQPRWRGVSAVKLAAVNVAVHTLGRCRAKHAFDTSTYRGPQGVVFPRDVHDVRPTVRVCAEHEMPVVGPRSRSPSGTMTAT